MQTRYPLDIENRIWTRTDGRQVGLSPLEVKLLDYLASRPNQYVRRSELLREVWGLSPLSKTQTIEVTVHRLRARLEVEPRSPQVLLSLHRSGYGIFLSTNAERSRVASLCER